MKHQMLAAAVLALGCAVFAAEENPLKAPTYLQSIKLKFATPEQAEAAQLEPLPLPGGKSVAFSTRWDDSNPRHVKMAELLKKYGYRGTFYLCAFNENFRRNVLPKLHQPGFSIGSHTLNHPRLTEYTPNRNFHEVMANRVDLESKSNTQVAAFVLPGFAYRSFHQEMPRMIGEVLERTGMLGSPEYFPDLEKEYGMPRRSWFVSFLFNVNDRDPSEQLFHTGVSKGYEHLQKHLREPHLTLGLHVWQSDEGLEKLGRCLDQYAQNPSWWYCNENEYLAYRYDFFHSKIVDKKVNGDTVVFTVQRIRPEYIGASLPLDFSVTPKPQSAAPPVELRDGGRFLSLAQDPKYDLRKIDAVDNPDNRLPKQGEFASAKFPDLTAAISVDLKKETCRVDFANNGKTLLRDIRVAFRTPPSFGDGVSYRSLSELAPGKSCTFARKLGVRRSEPEYQGGPLYFVAQIDFHDGSAPGRIYATTRITPPMPVAAVPRDTVRLLGPLPETELTDAELKKLSRPEAKLRSFGESANANWRRGEVLPGSLPATVALTCADADWKSGAEKARKAGQPVRLVAAFDFKAPLSGHARIYYTSRPNQKIFVNGELFAPREHTPDIVVQKGMNRILFVLSGKGNLLRTMEFSIAAGSNPHRCLEFVDPAPAAPASAPAP